jgi:tRNA threonylcarbamoyladenosine biosynthesis protein TsaB
VTTPFRPDAHYLALDTSGPTGFVAVGRGGTALAATRLEGQGRHAAVALVAVRDMLGEAGLEPTDLAGIVVGEGPGSFTGVRVAAATAKGLCRGLDVPLWAISSLAAGAVADLGSLGPGVRYVLFDARAERVYGGCYGVGSRGLETLRPPHAGDLRALLAGDVPAGTAFAGDGAWKHQALIEAAGFEVLAPPVGEPTGEALLHVLGLHPDSPALEDPGSWEPRYVKASNAEREWPS